MIYIWFLVFLLSVGQNISTLSGLILQDGDVSYKFSTLPEVLGP